MLILADYKMRNVSQSPYDFKYRGNYNQIVELEVFLLFVKINLLSNYYN